MLLTRRCVDACTNSMINTRSVARNGNGPIPCGVESSLVLPQIQVAMPTSTHVRAG